MKLLYSQYWATMQSRQYSLKRGCIRRTDTKSCGYSKARQWSVGKCWFGRKPNDSQSISEFILNRGRRYINACLRLHLWPKYTHTHLAILFVRRARNPFTVIWNRMLLIQLSCAFYPMAVFIMPAMQMCAHSDEWPIKVAQDRQRNENSTYINMRSKAGRQNRLIISTYKIIYIYTGVWIVHVACAPFILIFWGMCVKTERENEIP